MNEIGGDQIYGELSKLLMAGDSTNDVYIGAQYGMARTISEGGLVNVYDLEDMNFAQPWWWEVYMNELMLGDSTRFFLVGEFFIDALHNARTLYFNKNMYNRYHESSDDLYQQVLDGKWTLDQMMSLMRDVFIDVNNDGKTDNGDQLGYATYVTYSSVDAFVYATDIEFSKRNADGIVELNMMHDEAVTLAEKLVELFYMPGSYFGSTTIGGENTGLFVSGQALFLGNATLKGANALRDMKDDFGFLPYPKFDEAQEGYRTLVHDAVSIGAVNGSSQNLDVLGAVLEALNAETYRSVTPTWYDTALKIKYSRDDISTEMIDLIHDSITTNFIFAYNYALDNIGLLFRTLVTNKSTDYASEVKRVEKSAQKKLDTLISVFTENQ